MPKLLHSSFFQKLNLVPNTHAVQAQLRNSTKTFDDILRDWEDEFMNRKSRKGGNNQQQQTSTKSRRSRKKRKKIVLSSDLFDIDIQISGINQIFYVFLLVLPEAGPNID